LFLIYYDYKMYCILVFLIFYYLLIILFDFCLYIVLKITNKNSEKLFTKKYFVKSGNRDSNYRKLLRKRYDNLDNLYVILLYFKFLFYLLLLLFSFYILTIVVKNPSILFMTIYTILFSTF